MSGAVSLADVTPLELDVEDWVLSKVVERWAEREPDRVCVATEGSELTYGELELRASAVAVGLRELGVQAGDRVVTLYGENGLHVAYLAVALAKLGAIEVPVNPALVGPNLEHVVGEVAPRAVVVDPALREGLEPVLPAAGSVLVVESAGDRAERGAAAAATLDELLSGTGGRFPTASLPSDPGAIMYTSGTTGPPKGAIMPHRHLLGYGLGTSALLGLTPEDTLLAALPLFHAGGRGMNLIACLLTGSRCALVPRFSPRAFWGQARDHGATACHMVVSMAHFLLVQDPSPDDRAHSVERGIVAPPTQELAAAFAERYGMRVVTGYASTEANVCMINQDGPVEACGRVLPPHRAWVVDEHDRRLPTGEVGELVVASDEPWSMFAGYWNRPETTLHELRNFGFHTGDAARIDEDGYVWYVDRIKDMIRRRGENISALQVETAVAAIDGVLEAAAFGVSSPFGEEEVAVAVVTRAGVELTADRIAAECRQVLPRYAVPTFVRFLDALPKTPTGKLRKAALKEHGAEGTEEVRAPDA